MLGVSALYFRHQCNLHAMYKRVMTFELPPLFCINLYIHVCIYMHSTSDTVIKPFRSVSSLVRDYIFALRSSLEPGNGQTPVSTGATLYLA